MVRMRPEELPNTVRRDPLRSAEVEMYDGLALQLSDDWTVWYSVSWLGALRPDDVPQDGEADFVLAHPDLGVLVIEVKGGRIRYEARDRTWISRDRKGVDHKIDPFGQAVRSKHALIGKVKSLPRWKERWVDIGHAVAFPTGERPPIAAAPDALPEIIIGRDDLPDLKRRITEIAKYWQGRADHKQGGWRELVRDIEPVLGRDLAIRHPFRMAIRDYEEEIVRLTQDQFRLLGTLSKVRRAKIGGCAGSGKTFLAVEKARRLAAEGQRTLLTCRNRGLGDFLEQCCSDVDGLDVMTFQSLCTKVAGHRLPAIGPDVDSQELLDEAYPEALMQEAEENPGIRYDAIIVDEAQDFMETWWVALQSCLADPDYSILYIFFDSNQILYRGRGQLPDLPEYPLDENIRNTRSIFQQLVQFYTGENLPLSRGPVGRSVEVESYYDDQSLKREVGRLLQRLISTENIDATDIVVLTPRSLDRSALTDMEVYRGGPRLLEGAPKSGREIRLSSIYKFKGLESPVVILAEIDEVGSDFDRLLYVGLSRARAHLAIVAHASVADRFTSSES